MNSSWSRASSAALVSASVLAGAAAEFVVMVGCEHIVYVCVNWVVVTFVG